VEKKLKGVVIGVVSFRFPVVISLFGNELGSPPAHYQGGGFFECGPPRRGIFGVRRFERRLDVAERKAQQRRN
jgi:hypothetical protein